MDFFCKRLLDWYEENKRDLPWRESDNPYLIWISEIILQQTQVKQGYGYYLRFIERFPDLLSLAEATEEEVMKYWQGLGYYSRARNLHAAARSMQGVFPTTYQGVRALKGVGDYTAAAICSFAYGMPYAVVDGNVYRVLARYLGIDTPIDTAAGKKLFAALAQEMLDKNRPALYNQSIMDFGALQCTPSKPACHTCPLSDSCEALAKGCVDQWPVKQHKVKSVNRYFNYIYVRIGAYTVLKKRTEADIWQNLFEFPLVESPTHLSEEEFLRSEELTALLIPGEEVAIRPLWLNVKHVLSHRVIYANFYEVVLPENSAAFGGYLKIKQEELEQYAVSRLVHLFIEKYVDGIAKKDLKIKDR